MSDYPGMGSRVLGSAGCGVRNNSPGLELENSPVNTICRGWGPIVNSKFKVQFPRDGVRSPGWGPIVTQSSKIFSSRHNPGFGTWGFGTVGLVPDHTGMGSRVLGSAGCGVRKTPRG